MELFKLSGNVDLIHDRLTLAELKKKYGMCTCHFGDDQLNGRVRKSLIPGEIPRFKLASKPISEELMTKFLEQQNEPKTVLNKLETIRKLFFIVLFLFFFSLILTRKMYVIYSIFSLI